MNNLKNLSVFINTSKHTNSYFVENIFPIKIEHGTLPEADCTIEEYENERSRYCRACLSTNDLSPLEEDNSLLQLFQEITRIDVSANTNPSSRNSICYKCTNVLQEASLFLLLSMSNDGVLERLATTVIKKEELTIESDEKLESIVKTNLKVECKDEHATTYIKVCNDGFNEKNVSLKEAFVIKEEVIDSELMSSRGLSEVEELTIEGDGRLESIVERNYLKVECEDEHATTDIKVFEESLVSSKEENACKPLQESLTIKEEVIDSKLMVSRGLSEFESCVKTQSEGKSSENDLGQNGTMSIRSNSQSSKDVFKISKKLKEKPFECDYCAKGFDYKSNLQSHLLGHTGGNPFVCDYCGKEFSRETNLRSHLLTHTGEKPFKCTYCGKAFSQKHNLRSHLLIHTGEKPFKCDICHKEFTQKPTLLSHMPTHTGNKPFKCDYCGRAFARNNNLRTHLRSHTKEKPFKCDHCDKEFTRNSTLESHLLLHTGEKPFKCDYCGKGFAQNNNLRTHLRSHTKEKPYKCDDCGKGFSQNNSLRSHLLTHTGEKPFKCDYCDKGFALKGTLKCHLFTHTGEKPLECEYCGKGFSRKNNLKTHMRTHTGKKTFKCD